MPRDQPRSSSGVREPTPNEFAIAGALLYHARNTRITDALAEHSSIASKTMNTGRDRLSPVRSRHCDAVRRLSEPRESWTRRIKRIMKRVALSPISVVHLFRQYFFELDTFLGTPVSHVWLSPGSTVELIEIHTRRDWSRRRSRTVARNDDEVGDRRRPKKTRSQRRRQGGQQAGHQVRRERRRRPTRRSPPRRASTTATRSRPRARKRTSACGSRRRSSRPRSARTTSRPSRPSPRRPTPRASATC